MNNTALEFRSATLPLRNHPSDEGDLPSEWPLVSLGDLCSFANGVNANKEAYGKGIPFANVLEIITHSHLHSSEIPDRVLVSKVAQERFAVRRGDILFNRTSETREEVGLTAVYDDSEPIVFGGFVIRGRFNVDAFDKKYVGYALRAPIVRSQIISQGQGAIRANIGQSNLKRILIPMPSRVEQRAIAEALSDADELLRALEALIAKKRAMKQGAMQQLLTGKIRLPGFSEEWKTSRIGDQLVYERPDHYIVRSAEYTERGDVAVLTANKSFILGYTDETFGICRTIPAIVFDDFTTDCKFATFPFKVKSSAIKLLRPRNERVNLRYMFERMQLIRFPIGDHKRHYIAEYRHIELSLPRYEEQESIVSVLSEMEAEIAALEARRDKTRAIKQGMMQQLLTGRIRLVKPQPAEAEA
jgi:type I restriction enzyme S subunit